MLLAGPAAPILAGVALAAMTITALLPDPKKVREAQLTSLINSSAYSEPTSTTYNFDRFGRGYDSNKNGGLRSMGNITVNINALDASSLLDRREDIADAVRAAMNDAHGLNRTILEVTGLAA